MCGRFPYGFPGFPSRDSLSHTAALSNTSAPGFATWLAHSPLPGLFSHAFYRALVSKPASSFPPGHFTYAYTSGTLKYLYAVLEDQEPCFSCCLVCFCLLWRFPPGFTSCQPASSHGGHSRRGGAPLPAPPSGKKQDGAAGRGLWNLGSERHECVPCLIPSFLVALGFSELCS